MDWTIYTTANKEQVLQQEYILVQGYICIHKYTRAIWALCAMFAISLLLPRIGKVLEKFVLYLQNTEVELEGAGGVVDFKLHIFIL